MAIIRVSPTKVTTYYYSNYPTPHSKWAGEKRALGANFMWGVHQIQSKYLMRLDGEDDDFNVTFDSRVGMMMLECHPELKAVSPFYEIFEIVPAAPPKSIGTYHALNLIDLPQGAGIIYHRDAFLSIGYDTRLPYQADLDFYLRFTNTYKMGKYPAIYRWRKHQNQSLKHQKQLLRYRKEILDKYGYADWEVHAFGMYGYLGAREVKP